MYNEQFGERLKNLIKMKGYTQQEFAEKVGISRVYLADILRGKKGKRLSRELLKRFADTLDVSISELLGEVEENETEETLIKKLIEKRIKRKRYKKIKPNAYLLAEKRLKRALEDIDDLFKLV